MGVWRKGKSCVALAITLVGATLLGMDRTPVDRTGHMLPPLAAKTSLAWRELSFVDARGRSFQLKDFQGKILVIDFFFSSCPGVCPTQTAGLARAWAKIPEWAQSSIAFVSLTVDPKRDDSEKLVAYQQRFGIETSAWTFATGKQANIEAISQYFGSLAPGSAPLAHKAQIYLMGPQGQLLMNYPSAPLDSQRLSTDLAQAVEAFIPNANKRAQVGP